MRLAKSSFIYHTAVPLVVIIGVCILVYANSLRIPFVSDDVAIIERNPLVFRPEFHLLRPAELLNSFIYLFFGQNPAIHHLVSIALHAVNSVLVFFLLGLFFKAGPSLLGACLFAVHPVHCEAVSWISGRTYVILGLFTLVCYFLYYSATGGKEGGKPFNLRRYIACLLLFVYFIYSRYMYVFSFPFLLIASDIIFGQWRRRWKLWLPFLAIVPLRIILARQEIIERICALGQIDNGKLVLQNPILKATHSLFANFFLLLWPQKLSLYHDAPEPGPLIMGIELVLLVLLVASLPFLYRRTKAILLGAVFFILYLLPTFSPVTICFVVAERYLYLAPVLLSMTMAYAYERSRTAGKKISGITLALLICIVTLYAVRAFERNKEWAEPLIFWHKALEVSPHNAYVRNQMGNTYYSEGKFDKALAEFKKSIELSPDNDIAYINLGNTYSALGEKQAAIAAYQKAIAINPSFYGAYVDLGITYSALGEKQAAIAAYQKAIAINPSFYGTYLNLSDIYLASGKTDEAIVLLEKTIQLYPKLLPAYRQLVYLYGIKHRKDDITSLYQKAIAYKLDYFEAYYNIAVAYSRDNREVESIPLYKKAIRLNPKYEEAYAALGWSYCAVGRFQDAIRVSKKALELNPNSGMSHNNLAVAYYYTKEYQLAVQHCDRAVGLGYEVTPKFLELLKPYKK